MPPLLRLVDLDPDVVRIVTDAAFGSVLRQVLRLADDPAGAVGTAPDGSSRSL